MKQALDVAKLVALLAFAGLCIVASIAVFRVEHSLTATIDESHKTLVQLNRPGGTLNQLDKNLVDLHDTIIDAHKTIFITQQASNQEIASLQQWNADISRSLNNFDGVLVSLKSTSDGLNASQAQIAAETVTALKSADASIAGLQPIETQTTQAVAQLNTATKDLDALIANPDIPGTLADVHHITSNGVKMSDDAQKWFHNYLFPGPWHRVWSGVLQGAQIGVKVLVP